jgi:hypothetical protein
MGRTEPLESAVGATSRYVPCFIWYRNVVLPEPVGPRRMHRDGVRGSCCWAVVAVF